MDTRTTTDEVSEPGNGSRKRAGPAGRVPVVITIDTEPDDAWTNHQNPSVANVEQLLRLQALLDRYGAKATCLVTYRVIQDDRSVEVLQEIAADSGAEIGAHLHPWENPPYLESGIDARYPAFPHELPVDVFADKLESLTEAITRRITVPTSYRGGRWGLAPAHISVLEALHYEVDTSVTPWIDWRDTYGVPKREHGCGGIDYRRVSTEPYHPDYEDVGRSGGARLLEIPLSVAFSRPAPALIWRRYGSLGPTARRVLRKLRILRPVWATPTQCDRLELLGMLSSALAHGAQMINITFHSSELMLEGSPRSRTINQLDDTFARIEAMLEMLAADESCVFETLTQAARRWADGIPD